MIRCEVGAQALEKIRAFALRCLLFAALVLCVNVWAAELYQAQGIGPYGANPPGPTSYSGCISSITQLFPTRDAACQAVKSEQPLCDRSDAVYQGHVATLNSTGTSCHMSWQYKNTGSSTWNSWSADYPIYTCPDRFKARPSPMTGCAPVDEKNYAMQCPTCQVGNPILPLTGA